ncbi:hypothetical protein JOF56_000361 [Kibdelosporangium banguiense]|uniref:Tn3 transposase DDE domain-containing protein n=1 Tax=Kibdelosporangium banguiense TaxID=1365924 RepID=A0ABS4T7Z4_9PSEU|nr:hypothetical protein [Kibdelosporangium banguiense]MBP2319976.1 hypothetical protein [Kibdelosporangium banguiense]
MPAFIWDNGLEGMSAGIDVFKKSRDSIFPHTLAELMRMFGDFDLVEPGPACTAQWRSGGKPSRPARVRSVLHRLAIMMGRIACLGTGF